MTNTTIDIMGLEPIPFDNFAPLNEVNPILACQPPEWVTDAYAMVIDNTVHYL